ncbi:MAG: hypothetical protein ABF649_15285 [Bacillus sp. (in: firmicutes)]
MAKGILQGKKIEFSDESCFVDIDTQEMYKKYVRLHTKKEG